MQEFLSIALSMPTLAFSALLGVMLLYWVSVMVGAIDLHIFDPGGAAEGAMEGAMEGAVEGAVEGSVEGAVEGAMEGGAHAATEGALEAGAEHLHIDAEAIGGIAGAMNMLKLRYAPVTVVTSFLIVFSWLGTFFGSRYLEPVLPFGGWLAAIVVTLAALVLAFPLTSLVTRPLAPLFEKVHAKRNADLIGSVVVVKTGRVDVRFGQATLDDGQAGLLLRVRCDDGEALGRGDKALIVGWDEEANAFDVEPMDELLGTGDQKKQRRA